MYEANLVKVGLELETEDESVRAHIYSFLFDFHYFVKCMFHNVYFC